jgi:hypothetical protein
MEPLARGCATHPFHPMSEATWQLYIHWNATTNLGEEAWGTRFSICTYNERTGITPFIPST